jgi:hypothetical protein
MKPLAVILAANDDDHVDTLIAFLIIQITKTIFQMDDAGNVRFKK